MWGQFNLLTGRFFILPLFINNPLLFLPSIIHFDLTAYSGNAFYFWLAVSLSELQRKQQLFLDYIIPCIQLFELYFNVNTRSVLLPYPICQQGAVSRYCRSQVDWKMSNDFFEKSLYCNVLICSKIQTIDAFDFKSCILTLGSPQGHIFFYGMQGFMNLRLFCVASSIL